MSSCDCRKVKEMLQDVLAKECDKKSLKEFEEHIATCAHCRKCFEEEKEMLKTIKEKISHKCCPEDLLNKIKESILGRSSK